MFKLCSIFGRQGGKLRQKRGRMRRTYRAMVLETMERRLMLASSGLELGPGDLHAAQMTFESAHQPVTAAQIQQGGFISTPRVYGAAPLDGDISPAMPLKTNSFGADSFTPDVGFRTVALDGWALFGTNITIRPAVILSNYEGSWTAGLEPSMSDSLASEADQMEGGAISIEFILARAGGAIRSADHEASTSVETKVGTRPNATATWTGSKVSTDNALSAEWARAVVFEMAGGEPETSRGDRQNNSDGADATGGRRVGAHVPLLGAYAASAELMEANHSRKAEVPSVAGRLRGDHVQEPHFQLFRRTDLLHGRTDSGSFMPTLPPAEQIGAATPGMAADEADSATAEAFEQLAECDHFSAHSLAEYSRRTWEATPLLLLLALERIAARTSRRSTRRPSAVPGASVPHC